jgi:hypothetical protein
MPAGIMVEWIMTQVNLRMEIKVMDMLLGLSSSNQLKSPALGNCCVLLEISISYARY